MCQAAHGKPPREKPRLELVSETSIKHGVSAITAEQVLYGDRAQLALAMKTDYASWAEIAERCGYTSERTAFLAVKALMGRRQEQLDESLDFIRIRELERLEQMSAAAQRVMDAITMPDGTELTPEPATILSAVDKLVKVSESRRKLLGLDAAQKMVNDVHVKYTVTGIPEGDMP